MSSSSPPSTAARAAAAKKGLRRRSSSITQALNQIPLNEQEYSSLARVSEGSPPLSPKDEVKPLSGPPKPRRDKKKVEVDDLPDNYATLGFWKDLKTGRWMLVPASSLKLALIPIVLYANHELLARYEFFSHIANPFKVFLWPSYELPNGLYQRGVLDWLFLGYYVIVWSFVRQFMTIHVLRPLAHWLGVNRGGKTMRFTEQGYAVFYFGILGHLGFFVMKGLPIWFYKTDEFWRDYPHREMTLELKAYYLLQAAYWVQQTIILAAKIEKPRKDFKELVAHHIVTLWLIGWSYTVYLTHIGVAIFLSMDYSDTWLGLAKCVNYVNETASVPVFAFFVLVWSYFRHYQNIRILWSVWYEWDLIPLHERLEFAPWNDKFMAKWMKYQIFIPILLLQFINLFWYFLILRILYRAIFTVEAVKDERSDDEDEDEAVAAKKK